MSRSRPESTPGWVKAFAIVAIVLALVVVVSLLLGVRHGPGRHTAPAIGTEQIVRPPSP